MAKYYSKIMKIAIIGTFQVGKSTLVNCLVNDSLAGVGIGNPTTHALNYYKNNITPEILCWDVCGRCLYRQAWNDQIYSFLIPPGTVRVMHELPDSFDLHGNILIDTPGLDSAGKDASWDNERTEDIINDRSVDLLMLVVPNRQLDSSIRNCVLPCIKESKKKLIVLMNCILRSAPDPNSSINLEIASQIDEELRAFGIRHSRVSMNSATKVLPINAVWWWISQRSQIKPEFCNQQTETVFKERCQEIKNYFSIILDQSVPSSEMLQKKSNLFHLFSYLYEEKMREEIWNKDNPPFTNEQLRKQLFGAIKQLKENL